MPNNSNSAKPRRSTPGRDTADDNVLELEFNDSSSSIELPTDRIPSSDNNSNSNNNNSMFNASLPISSADGLDFSLMNTSLPMSAADASEVNVSLPVSEPTDEWLAEGRRRARIINLNPRRPRNDNTSNSNVVPRQDPNQQQQQHHQQQQQQQQNRFSTSNRQDKPYFFSKEVDLKKYQKSKNVGYAKSIAKNAKLAEDHLPRFTPIAERITTLRETTMRSSATVDGELQKEENEIDEKVQENASEQRRLLEFERDLLLKVKEIKKEREELKVARSALDEAAANLDARRERNQKKTERKLQKLEYAEGECDRARRLIAESQATTGHYAGRPLPQNPRQFNQYNSDVERSLKKIFKAKQLTDECYEFLGIPLPKKFVPKEIKSNNICDEVIRKWDLVMRETLRKRLRPSSSTEFQDNRNNSSSSNNRTYLPRNSTQAGFPASDIRFRDEQEEQEEQDKDAEQDGDDANDN